MFLRCSIFLIFAIHVAALQAADTPTKDEEKLVDAVAAKSGMAEINYKAKGEARVKVQFDHPTDADLAAIKGSKCVVCLEIMNGDRISEKGMGHIRTLTGLETLAFGKSHPTAAGLAGFKDLSNLTSLYLGEAKIGDAGMEYIKRMTQLKKLDLYKTLVTDKAIVVIKSMNNLEDLNLANTKITDEGAKQLKGMSQLKLLDVQNTKVTQATIKMLEDSITGITIRR